MSNLKRVLLAETLEEKKKKNVKKHKAKFSTFLGFAHLKIDTFRYTSAMTVQNHDLFMLHAMFQLC